MEDSFRVNNIYNFIDNYLPGDAFELLKKYYGPRFLLSDFLESIGSNFAENEDIFLTTQLGNKDNYLASLADRYGSDKGTKFESFSKHPWPSHNYSLIYESIFHDIKENVNSLFEMGIGTIDSTKVSNMTSQGFPGASLLMWRDYFPNARIIGGDIDEKCMIVAERIETFVVDQTNSNSLISMFEKITVPSFDVFIDDGLHTFEAGKTLFEVAWEHININGYYIIEDIIQTDLDLYYNYFKDRDLSVRIISGFRPNIPLFDNSLIIIRK
jgi:hypothetical protein